MNEPGPEKSGGVQLAARRKKNEESRRGERSVEAVKDRRDLGRGSHGMMMLRINCCRKRKGRDGGVTFG